MQKLLLIVLSILLVLILLGFIVSSIANMQFDKMVKQEVKAFFSQRVLGSNETVKAEDLKDLPPCVQQWLKSTNILGKEHIQTVRLKQNAMMRLKPEASWVPAKVEQYFRTEEPGFIWQVGMKAASVLPIVGRDKYVDGKGNMLIKILALIKVADASGKEVDQGTLLRYLAETMWFPSAALSDYIKWEEIDAHSAKATMRYGEITASGIFEFNEKGEVTGFTAQRYMDNNGKYSLETWHVALQGYKTFEGIKVPYKGELIWKLKSGDFKWYQFEVTEIEYNKPAAY